MHACKHGVTAPCQSICNPLYMLLLGMSQSQLYCITLHWNLKYNSNNAAWVKFNFISNSFILWMNGKSKQTFEQQRRKNGRNKKEQRTHFRLHLFCSLGIFLLYNLFFYNSNSWTRRRNRRNVKQLLLLFCWCWLLLHLYIWNSIYDFDNQPRTTTLLCEICTQGSININTAMQY